MQETAGKIKDLPPEESHITHSILAVAVFLSAFQRSGVVFFRFHSIDFLRSAVRIASCAHSGQYFCRPDFTTYSLPHTVHLSVLPSGRRGLVRLRFALTSRFRSAPHSGQYLEFGYPGNSLPHTVHTRILTTDFLTRSAHSGQAVEPGSPSYSLPQYLHIRFIESLQLLVFQQLNQHDDREDQN